MSPAADRSRAEAPVRGALWAIGALLLLLPILPPETRGESQAGCAALLAVLGTLAVYRGLPVAGAVTLAAALGLAWPILRAAAAPGAAVEPVARALLAGAGGLFAAAFASKLGRDFRIAAAVAAAGGIVGAHALYQRLWGLEAAATALEDGRLIVADPDLVLARLRDGRAYAAFATPAALGGFLALALPVTVGLAIGRGGRARAGLLALAGVEAAGLVASESVTAAGALLVACLVGLAGRRGAKTLAASVLAGAVLAGAVVLLRGEQVLGASSPDSPWRLRAGNFRVAAEMIRDAPWVGVGPGGYAEMFPLYRQEGDNESHHVHDLPFELAAELGLPLGIPLALAFYVLFLSPLLRGRSPVAWRVGLEVGLFAFAVQNLGDFTAFSPSLLWTAALLRGVTWDATAEAEGAPRSVASAALATPVFLGALLAAGLFGLGGLSWNARVEARSAAAGGEGRRAIELTRRAARLAPWNPDARLFHGGALSRTEGSAGGVADLVAALAEAEAAVRGSPVRPAARDLRASLRLRAGDVAGAYADWSEAARLYPIQPAYAERRDEVGSRLFGDRAASSGK